jgi:hypothetical protein
VARKGRERRSPDRRGEDGPAAVSIAFMPMKNKVIVLIYWVTTAKEKEDLEEVGKILHGIKPAS